MYLQKIQIPILENQYSYLQNVLLQSTHQTEILLLVFFVVNLLLLVLYKIVYLLCSLLVVLFVVDNMLLNTIPQNPYILPATLLLYILSNLYHLYSDIPIANNLIIYFFLYHYFVIFLYYIFLVVRQNTNDTNWTKY